MAQKRFSQGPGPSQRQLRVGELIRRRLSEVLARGDVHDPDLNRMFITVGEVRASADLKVATAYVSPLGGQGREEALAALRRNRGELRRMVASALALKYAPELRFAHDETFDRLDETRRLFAQEAVRRDLEAEEHEMDSDRMQETRRGQMQDSLPGEERDPTAPLRDIRDDLPRRSDRDSDTVGGASDWDDADEDKLPEDFDPYRSDDGTEPLDRLIRPEAPASTALDRAALGEEEEDEDGDLEEEDPDEDEEDLDEDDIDDDLDEDDDFDDEDLDDEDLDEDADPDGLEAEEGDDLAPPRPTRGARAH